MKLNSRIRVPIILKLGGITTLLMLAAGLSITFSSAHYLEGDALDRQRQMNMEQIQLTTQQLDSLLSGYLDKVRTLSLLIAKDSISDSLRLSLEEDRDIVNLELYRLKDGKTELVKRVTQERYLKDHAIDHAYFQQLRLLRPFPLASVFAHNIEIQNSSAKGAAALTGLSLLTIGQGLAEDENGQTNLIAIADVRLESLQSVFSHEKASKTFFLVDKIGRTIAYPNDQWVFDNRDLKGSPIVKRALDSKAKFEKKNFTDPQTTEDYLGAYGRTSYGPIVGVQVPLRVILEPVRKVKKAALTVTAYVISIAFFLIFLFSITLTSPIERLVQITRQVAAGNFDIKSDVRSHDEVGELAHSFDTMVTGLKERDKMRNVLNKFHGSHVADDLLKGDLALGGSDKNVTVFFSDIRDFTKFSEGHSPEEVVGMLNEYFAIMVGIIVENHGIVDKFVGDAIMAVWGAPNSSGDDQNFALKACIEMRSALAKLNESRLARGKTALKIGMGLHTGRAISGTIGSSERMEYTVIGDTVNMTARIEASTKAFGTDLLVSQSILDATVGKYVCEFAGAAEVKGKSEPIKMYRVLGYVDANGQPVLVQTLYSDYETAAADKVRIVTGAA